MPESSGQRIHVFCELLVAFLLSYRAGKAVSSVLKGTSTSCYHQANQLVTALCQSDSADNKS